MRVKYDYAAAVRKIFKIIGIGALVAIITSDVADGAVGVALDEFIGIVINFASSRYWNIIPNFN